MFAVTSVVSLEKLCSPLPCFVLYSKDKFSCYSRYLLTSYFCIPVPYDAKNIFFGIISRRSLFLEGSNQSVLKEISPEYSLEGLMLTLKLQYFGPPDAKNWLTGQDWMQEKGMTEDEIIGWHHQLYGHEFEQAPGVMDRAAWRAAVHGRTWLSNWTDWTDQKVLKVFVKPLNFSVFGICGWGIDLDYCVKKNQGAYFFRFLQGENWNC